jgi:ACR3 family arsenite transporter
MKTPSPIGNFERYLSLWVALCIVAGIVLGSTFPDHFQRMAGMEYGSVNFIVAVLIWLMVYPMMVSVAFSSLKRIHERPKGLIITLVVNWLIKPFTMAGLGVLFFHYFFIDLIDPANTSQYIAGLILLGAAPCTAMVFVWSQLTRGDATYTLAQVAMNNVIMIFALPRLLLCCWVSLILKCPEHPQ